MKNWKSLLLLALVFLAGIAVGVIGTRVAIHRVMQQAIAHPERVQAVMERALTHRLRLDTDQQAKLHTILTDMRGQLRQVRQQVQPQTTLIVSNTDEKISALLTPEQQARYQKLKEQDWPALRPLRALRGSNTVEPPPVK